MKRFLKVYNEDRNGYGKPSIKMINQSIKGFELVILSNDVLSEINSYDKNDDIYIIWQMKFKPYNYTLYRNCKFSEPVNNFHPKSPTKVFGKKIKVTCGDTSFYSNSLLYKNQNVKSTNEKYKDGKLLERMLKIGELNLRSKKNGTL